MARFHAYSFSNILSIVRARPDATRVAGIRTWTELGRFVKRGEKGIPILAPMVEPRRRKNEANQNNSADVSAKPQPVLIEFSWMSLERDWWAVRDLNPRHPACKAGALTS